MNNIQKEIILYLKNNEYETQRIIASNLNISLGLVNKEIKSLKNGGYLTEKNKLTEKTNSMVNICKPKRAIILAAGICTRMVPINSSIPKALLRVNDEVIIEKQIKFLHDVGIKEIYIVVGYMKEKFEYLIDKYNVELIVNPFYNIKNNYYSLYLVRNKLSNAYIIPSDIVMYKNPFSKYEIGAWYMFSEKKDTNSEFKVNKNKSVSLSHENAMHMIGIAYITSNEAKVIEEKLTSFVSKNVDDYFWEKALQNKNEFIVNAKMVNDRDYYEINSYEDLRNIDQDNLELEHKAIKIICDTLKVNISEIKKIKALKKGMTNKSFCFEVNHKKYIMRIPGEGTDKLISRKNEYNVYSVINGKNIADNVIYMNSENGFKLTEFIENARVCNYNSKNDLKLCMSFLKKFHNLNLKLNHSFDIFANIAFYEKLRNGHESDYVDYLTTKKNVLSLKDYIEKNIEKICLCHIDSVADNFLIFKENGIDKVRLIDFEYAGMQDPDVDIAMFCIYSMLDRKQIDNLIDIYYEENCKPNIRIKIYCYIAACGLLWSNWCEYKKILGIEFGEYSLKQYRYAKEYYKIAINEMEKLK